MINGIELDMTNDDAYDMTIQVAKGELTREQVALAIAGNCKPLSL